jgi:hypothetical protein
MKVIERLFNICYFKKYTSTQFVLYIFDCSSLNFEPKNGKRYQKKGYSKACIFFEKIQPFKI